jgi:hypothetical protein
MLVTSALARPSKYDSIGATLATVAVSGIFNQYADLDPELDQPDAAMRRRQNLSRYLEAFGDARYVLIGEAAGYAACRFSGVPFTDECQLIGPAPLDWAGAGQGFQRASRSSRALLAEASARVVWAVLGSRRDVVLWNVVPWHPIGSRGALSNAPPPPTAQRAGREFLQFMLREVWSAARPIAVGRVAERALQALGYPDPTYVRHPAHGGQTAFRLGLAQHCPARAEV